MVTYITYWPYMTIISRIYTLKDILTSTDEVGRWPGNMSKGSGHQETGGEEGCQEEGHQEGAGDGRTLVTETPILIMYTKDSNLRKLLQETDRFIDEATKSPSPF